MAVEIIQRLAVEVGANIKAFTQKMARVVKASKATAKGFGALGARLKGVTAAIRQTAGKFRKSIVSMKGAILGLVTGLVLKKIKDFVSTVVDLGDQMAKTAKKVGVGVETLSGLKLAADLAGSSFESVAGSFRRLSSAAFDANAGLLESQRAFDALGVQVTDTEGNLRPLEDLFFDAADGLAALSSDTERAALAQDLFGRAGLDLIPLLKQGSKEIRKQIKLAKELGITFSVKDAKAAEEFKDQLTLLRAALFGFASGIVKQVVPAFTEFFKTLTTQFRGTAKEGKSFTEGLSEFIKGLLFTTIGAVELMKSIWNGLKIIWLGLQAAFFGLQAAFVSGFIKILFSLRNFIGKFQEGFDTGFSIILGQVKKFAPLFIKVFGIVLKKVLELIAFKLGDIANIIRAIPIKRAEEFGEALQRTAAQTRTLANNIKGMGDKVNEAIQKFKFKPAKTAVEALDKAILSFAGSNEELRGKLAAVKEELDKLVESESISFIKRTAEEVLKLNAAFEENKVQAQAQGDAAEEAAARGASAFTELQKKALEALKGMTASTKGFLGLLGNTITQFSAGIGNAISRAIVFGENFAKSIKALFKDIAASIIAQLVQIIITALIAQAALSFFGIGAAGLTNVAATAAQAGGVVASVVGGLGGAASAATGGTALAHGGIVTKPTMALIGEAGPEAVIPLDRGGMAGMQTIQIFMDGDMIAETVVERMPEVLRVNAGLEL